jgi:hypothetical protein
MGSIVQCSGKCHIQYVTDLYEISKAGSDTPLAIQASASI